MFVALNTITNNLSFENYKKVIYDFLVVCCVCSIRYLSIIIATCFYIYITMSTSGVSQCTYANTCWCNKKVIIWFVRLIVNNPFDKARGLSSRKDAQPIQ